jgi:hypothetical protein
LKILNLNKKKIAFAEMKDVKTKFEKREGGEEKQAVAPKPVRSITPPREGANRVEIENEPQQRSADVISAYEKVADTLPDEGYIRARKEAFDAALNSPDKSSAESSEQRRLAEDQLPTAGQIKQTAAMFAATTTTQRQKSIERSGITLEGELTEKGIAKSRLALFSDPNGMGKEHVTPSTAELEAELFRSASGVAKERMNMFKNMEQQQQQANGGGGPPRLSPGKEVVKKFKEFTPPPQLDPHLQRQYIIIDKEGSPSAADPDHIKEAYNKEEYVPESGLAKNRIKQYLENSAAASSSVGAVTAAAATGVEELQGKAKSLLAKWKSIENVKETSPELTGGERGARKSTSSNEGAEGSEFLPERGHAKSLLNKWQNIDAEADSGKEQRRGPRAITPPPPEELERIAVCLSFFPSLRFAKCKTRRIVSEVKNFFTTVFSVFQNLEKPILG